MDKRTKQLSIAFATLIGCALVYKVVYPTWIEPLTTLDDRTAVAQRELDELRENASKARQAKEDYRELVERIASFDATDAQNAISVKINDLIKRHKFQDADTSRRRGKPDRKTKIIKSSIVVKGKTELASAVGFLEDVAELPELIRVGKPAISPVRASSRKGPQKGPQIVNMTVPIEFWVLPQDRMIGRLDKEDLIQPDRVVRHDERDYSHIWTRNPLTEVIPAPPLKVTAGKDVRVKARGRTTASGSASGGIPPYKYSWEPSELVDKPTTARPFITSTDPGTHELTLRVTDAEGVKGSDTIRVTIPKPPDSTETTGTPPPEKKQPEKEPRWRDRKYMQLAMTLSRTEGDRRIAEVMIHNMKNKETDYYTVGDEFNGGELIYVHSRGGLVFRGGKYYVHPIGDRLDTEIHINDAGAYPRFQLAAQKHGKLIEAQQEDAAKVGGDKKPSAQGKPSSSKVKPGSKAKQPTGKNAPKTGATKPPSGKKAVTKKKPKSPPKRGAKKSTGNKKSRTKKDNTKKTAAESPIAKKAGVKTPGAKQPAAKKRAKPATPAASDKKPAPAKAGESGAQETSSK